MPYSALIFDLDGVIIDSEALHNAAVAAALAEQGVELPPAIFDQFMGIPDEIFLAYASEHYLGGRVPPADLLAAKQRCYLAMQDQLQPIPGALEFLAAMRPQVQHMALVTSSLRHNQQLAFARFSLADYFDVVITAEDVTHTKPHPEPYQRAVERLGLLAAACLVFEDSLHGVRSALAAGCEVIALTTSYPAEALREAGATHVCGSYGEIAVELAILRYQTEDISLAKAAHLAGMSYDRMKELMHQRGIQLWLGPVDDADIQEEIAALKKLLDQQTDD